MYALNIVQNFVFQSLYSIPCHPHSASVNFVITFYIAIIARELNEKNALPGIKSLVLIYEHFFQDEHFISLFYVYLDIVVFVFTCMLT